MSNPNLFSFITGGTTNVITTKFIDFNELVQLVQFNPEKEKINQIRKLRLCGDLRYKELKKTLSYVTPNSRLHCRKLSGENFQKNWIAPSGYLYIDIDLDDIEDVDAFKSEFINRYKDVVAMVSYSCSKGGISVLVKVTNTHASIEEFNVLYQNLIEQYFSDYKIDTRATDIGRAWFISYDENVFVNTNNCITVGCSLNNKKGISKSINTRTTNIQYTSTCTLLNFIEISVVLKKVKLKTIAAVENNIVDFIPLDFASVTFPNTIKDTHKHKVYTSLIHGLVYLNPDLEPDYIFSYVSHVNRYYAKPPMELKKLIKFFNFVYYSIKENKDYRYLGLRTKNVHFNANKIIDPNIKRKLAAQINGAKKKSDSISKILDARLFLDLEGVKVTAKKIAQHTGLSISTVKSYYNVIEVPQLSYLLNQINSMTGLTETNIIKNSIKEEYFHPTCPIWVTNYYK